VVTEALETLGCRILQARDGAEGLRMVQSDTPFDLLVTDVGLPGLNGRQLADAARAHRPDLPILLITGYAGTALDDMGLAHGMELTRKPFVLDAFAAQVSRMLDRAFAPGAHPAD
jgi:CheY-like chemotaxis protein